MKHILCLLALLPTPLLAQSLSPEAGEIETCLSLSETIEDARIACSALSVNPCLDSTEGATTVGMVGCFAKAEGHWDELRVIVLDRLDAEAQERDAYYKSLGEDGFAESAASLATSETTWAAWRDAECISRADDNGNGSMRRIVAAACRLDLMRERVLSLWFR